LGAVGHQVTVAPRDLEIFPGVQEVHRISAPYELAARGFRPEGTSIEFRNGLVIGGPGGCGDGRTVLGRIGRTTLERG
jgi:3-deoxy-7-phosphoheptulonate synthase